MGTNLTNTALPGGTNRNWMRGLVLLVVLAGILASIWAVARHRTSPVNGDEMVVSGDTREHGVSLSDEQAGKTGLTPPSTSGNAVADAGHAVQGSGTAGAGTPATGGEASMAPDTPHPPSHYTSLPGIEIASFPAETQRRILDRANHEHCTCKCGMTVAECRNEDSTCRHSLQVAAEIVAKEAGDDIKKGLITD